MFRTLIFAITALAAVSLLAQEPVNPADLGTAALTREDGARSNSLSYGVSSSTAYDDNVQGSNGRANVTSSIQPQFGLWINRPRLQTHLFYGPSYTFSTNVASQSDASEAVGADVQYLFSRRLTLSVRGSFLSTSNPLESINAAALLPQLGILDRPTQDFAGARVHQTMGQAASNLVYRVSAHTSAGIGASFTHTRYSTILDGFGAVNNSLSSQTWSAHTFLSQQVSPRFALGVNYAAQNFASMQSGASTLTHSALAFTTVSLSPHIQASIFAGPEFSYIHSAPAVIGIPESEATSLSFGSTISWQGEKNGLAASFMQRVSDSVETSAGAVRARVINVRANRQITRRITANLFTYYVSNTALVGAPTNVLPDSISGGLGFSRFLTPRIVANLSAFHQEFMSGAPLSTGLSSHEVVSISITYSFSRPIGR